MQYFCDRHPNMKEDEEVDGYVISKKNLNTLVRNYYLSAKREAEGGSIKAMVTNPFLVHVKEKDEYKRIDACMDAIYDSDLNANQKSFMMGQLLNFRVGIRYREEYGRSKDDEPTSPFYGLVVNKVTTTGESWFPVAKFFGRPRKRLEMRKNWYANEDHFLPDRNYYGNL